MLGFLNKFTSLRDIGIKDKINIREKLIEQAKENNNLYEDIKNNHGLDLEDFIFVLGDSEAFKKKYLMPHYKLYNTLNEINEKIKQLRLIKLTDEELKKHLEYFEEKKLELADSKLELYLCNAVSGNPKALKILAGVAMPFGLLHTGLLIDEICIQWGRGLLGDSLVEPWTNVKYNDYIFAMEIQNEQIWSLIKETYSNLTDYITSVKPYENMGTLKAFNIADSQLNDIANICTNYNKNKKYHLVFENCQHFVCKILDKLKLKVYKKGEVKKIIKISQEKMNPFDFQFGETIFKKRKDLDEFVMKLDFKNLPYDQRMVLFNFKNVFEYYRRNNPNDEKYIAEDHAQEFWNELLKNEKFEK